MKELIYNKINLIPPQSALASVPSMVSSTSYLLSKSGSEFSTLHGQLFMLELLGIGWCSLKWNLKNLDKQWNLRKPRFQGFNQGIWEDSGELG